MSLRRKYPNNKTGRKQRRLAEASDSNVPKGEPIPIEAVIEARVSMDSGEHAMILCEVAEDRLKRNLPQLSNAELEERMRRLRHVLLLVEQEWERRAPLSAPTAPPS